jgi:pyruvate/2-oxoglutarate dehydrogenase complex dihydrolipoamide acyltransferase (E2) component
MKDYNPMNSIRQLLSPPAQRAATEMRTALNGVAADVREMSTAVDELSAREKMTAESALPMAKPAAEETPRSEFKPVTPPANGNAATEIQETGRRSDVATPTPDARVMPPALTLPQVPDIRPQLEAVRDALVRNQQTTVDTVRAMRLLLDAYGSQLAELREQIKWQQNVVSNMRRF